MKRGPRSLAGPNLFACGLVLFDQLQVHGLRAFALRVRQRLEVDALAFDERRETRALDRAHVNEHVSAAIVRRHEAEATGRVEELHGAVLRIAERCARGPIAAAETTAAAFTAETAATAA